MLPSLVILILALTPPEAFSFSHVNGGAALFPRSRQLKPFRKAGALNMEKTGIVDRLSRAGKKEKKSVSASASVVPADDYEFVAGGVVGTRGGALSIKNIAVELYGSYLELLEKKPMVTKSVTTGILSAVGDVAAQFIEAYTAGAAFALNWVRLASFAISGGFYVGPFVHLWYKFLSKIGKCLEVKFRLSKGLQTLAQVFVDQTLGVALFFPAYFYIYEYIEAAVAWRAPVAAIATAKIRDQLFPVLMMQYRVWPITNYINFSYVPENLRVLFQNFIAMFWNAFLCTRVA